MPWLVSEAYWECFRLEVQLGAVHIKLMFKAMTRGKSLVGEFRWRKEMVRRTGMERL